jgi:hypothetical protein
MTSSFTSKFATMSLMSGLAHRAALFPITILNQNLKLNAQALSLDLSAIGTVEHPPDGKALGLILELMLSARGNEHKISSLARFPIAGML